MGRERGVATALQAVAHTQEGSGRCPVQDQEHPGSPPLPEVSQLLCASHHLLLPNTPSQPFSQQHQEAGSGDLDLYLQMRKPRLRVVRRLTRGDTGSEWQSRTRAPLGAAGPTPLGLQGFPRQRPWVSSRILTQEHKEIGPCGGVKNSPTFFDTSPFRKQRLTPLPLSVG